MGKTLIAIAFSDLHWAVWGKYGTRKDTAESILEKMVKISHGKRVPILHCGDLFHKPEVIENGFFLDVVNHLSKLAEKYPKYRLCCISGNHSCPQVNKVDSEILSWENTLSKLFPNMESLDFGYMVIKGQVVVHGVPYLDNNLGLGNYLKDLELDKKYHHILMLHSDFPGAKDNNGMEIGSVDNININMLDKFGLVLMGHIHKPQRLSKKVYMLGAPYQQRSSDKGAKLGYWEIYNDLSVKFIELSGYPQYIEVDDPDKVKDDGNYYVISVKKIEVEESNGSKITLGMSKKRAVKKYLKVNGITDKKKSNILLNLIEKAEEND